MSAITLDTSRSGWLDDPYPQYRALRERDPVHWSESLDHWLLTRHRDVALALKDPRFSAANRPPQRRWARPTTMVTSDPPDHSRLRRPVNHRFTSACVEALRERIQEVVDQLLEGAAEREFDVVSQLARPLPQIIISEMLGLDGDSLPRATAAGRPGGMATSTIIPNDAYVLTALEGRSGRPTDDLIGDLASAHAAGDMSDEEVLDTTQILYAAGQETTAKMISNGVYYLLRHPRQLGKLRSDPVLLSRAVEEILRFDTPVHAIGRKALVDIEMGGRTIAKGQKVLCLMAAANRDPEVFERPEEFDVERVENPHLTFGTGAHLCLGAGLARGEIEASMGTLVSRYPSMRLADEDVEWEGSLIIRGLRSLRVDLAG